MIFISYRISDSLDLVDRLDGDLTRVFGDEAVFRDKSRLLGGQDWTNELDENAKGRKVMLVVIGATWQTAADKDGDFAGVPRLWNPEDWVRREITLALDAGNTVIPVLLNDAKFPSRGWLANCQLGRLYSKQAVKLRTLEYEKSDLADLIALLRKLFPGLSPTGDGEPQVVAAPARRRLPAPPDLYAVPNYILTNTFIGRATELDQLDAWAASCDPLMVVEGIGGLGKSALTWEWVQKRATYAIHDLAGRVWWSFYEKGTSMAVFVRHALAYITGQDPDTLVKETSHFQRCQELLTELKRRPYLLVLDGFERVLSAYHRWDKAQQRDDKIETTLRECVDPKDTDLLQQLLHAGQSKVLISTRLFPSCLEDRASGRPCVGVSHHKLNGLSRPDALAFYKHAGIQGNEQAMLEFAEEFGNHSLLLKVICGEIATYPRKPFHFDEWRADLVYGGKLVLSELDLKQRYNHILKFALEGLDANKRKLLCRIAVLSENVDYDTLAVLNPYLPPKPTEAALKAYLESPQYRQAIREFDKALTELQDRGLLQWDRENGYYDMHPVVRGHAAEWLEDRDRTETFLAARDHFASLPPDDFDKATELFHVEHSVEIFRCLVGAGRFDEAVVFYLGGLSNSLLFNLGANTSIVELLTPLFRGGKDGLPHLKSPRNQSCILNHLACAMVSLRRKKEAFRHFAKAIFINVGAADWSETASHMYNKAMVLFCFDSRVESVATLALARELAEADENQIGVSMAIFGQAAEAIGQGRFSDGTSLLAEFLARPLPPIGAYRPGEAEYGFCLGQFCQGALTEAEWKRGYDIAVEHRNVIAKYGFLAIQCEWLLKSDQSAPALDAIDDALKIVNRLGTPRPDYHDLRAWALAKLGRTADACAELANGEKRYFAAEAWKVLGDRDQFLACTLNAYKWAWGEGPPYIRWYTLERCRALLKELGEPEPQLPPFDPSKVPPIPYEAEIRAAIEKLKAEKAARDKKPQDD